MGTLVSNLDFKTTAGPVTESPELDLQFSDEQICEVIDRKIVEYTNYLTEHKIKDRSEKLVNYWKGEQVDAATKVAGQKYEYINNIIHRDLETRIKNATSRMPDIVATSPEQQEDLTVRDSTQKTEQWLNIRIDNDVTRRLAKNALRDNHLQFRGIWKYRYDHFKKDAVIERPRPEDVILDSTARIPEDGFTADNMEFIGEWIEEPTAVVLAKFPDKKQEILDELGRESVKKGSTSRASKMRYLECWATMHDRDGVPHELLVQKYNTIILFKGTNPYYDYTEETTQQFGIVSDDSAPELPEDRPQPKRKNHFSFPRKPYTVFSGENRGTGPLDDTNVVEISLPMQDIVNKRGNQISAVNDWAIPKIVTSKAYMDEEKASNITRDPSEIIVLDETEDIRGALMAITGQPASPALYNDMQSGIQAIDAHFSTQAASRGEEVSDQSGISKQISREGDLSSADEISQTMVQRAVEEAANWMVQLGKIYFEEPNTAIAPGADNSMQSASISQETIPDHLQIVVKANSMDKPTLRNMMMNLAGMKAVDPFTLYEALDVANPKETTKRLVDFLNGPPSGYVNYLQDVGINPLEPAYGQSESQGAPGDGPLMPPPSPGAPPVIPQGLPAGGSPPPISQ